MDSFLTDLRAFDAIFRISSRGPRSGTVSLLGGSDFLHDNVIRFALGSLPHLTLSPIFKLLRPPYPCSTVTGDSASVAR